jgi:hypothetical protein
MPICDSGAMELAQLLGSGTAGALIPEPVRQGLEACSRTRPLQPFVTIAISEPLSAEAIATAGMIGCWPHQLAMFSCVFLRFALAASFLRCSSPAAVSTGPCGPW